jgi:hypothetical protein
MLVMLFFYYFVWKIGNTGVVIMVKGFQELRREQGMG